jgi:hypothetical protein
MKITKKSTLTGNVSSMELDITIDQIAQWQGGKLIQNVFPNLTPSEREFLMNGITEAEWNEVFGEEE